MKIKQLLGFICLSVLAILSSCNKSTTNSSDPLSSDAQISSLTLNPLDSIRIKKTGIQKSPSLDSLSANEIYLLKNPNKIFFTIDQLKGEIYNPDSLPKGLQIGYLSPIITTTNTPSKITFQFSDNTTLNYTGNDTINLSKPVKIIVTALDGSTQKEYTFKINVHKQNPNQIDWKNQLISSWGPITYDQSKTIFFNNKYLTIFQSPSSTSFYTSSDALNWTGINPISGFPTDAKLESVAIFGNKLFVTGKDQSIYSSDNSGFSWTKLTTITGVQNIIGSLIDTQNRPHLIVIKNNQLFASTDGTTFSACSNSLPNDFPTSGFSTITNSISSIQRLTVIGGRGANGLLNTVHQMYWSKSGLQLALNINNNDNSFASREGAISFYYDNKMYLLFGKDETNSYNDIYTSSDYGIRWSKPNPVQNLPETFEKRSFCSVVIDENKSILIFGGNRNDNSTINDIWKGRLNRFGFIIQ